MISLYAIRRHLISPLSIILAFVLTLYLRLIISAGFMVDDACQAARFPLRLWDDLVAWQGTWSIRPVSWLLMPVAIHIFHGKTFLFFALNSLLYLTAAFLLSSSLSLAANKFTRFFIFTGISLPIFSDSVILSPVNQLSATLSIVFFALGLQLQKMNFSRFHAWFAFVFYILSFLSYEISFGLILLIPIALLGTNKKALKSVQAFNSLLPVSTALALSLIWQKVVVPALFGSSNTRLASPDPFGVFEYLNVWLIEIPKKIFAEQLILGFLSLVCILLIWRIKRGETPPLDTKHWAPYLILLAVSPSVLYIFSGYHATSNGYLNRGLSTAWIVNVVLIAHLIQSAPYKRTLLVLPCILALLLFQGRINDAIHVSKQRALIANSVISGISDIDSSSLYNKRQPAIILADVPCTAWDSRNRLTIYCTSWDLSSELALRGFSNLDVLPLGARLQFPEYLERIYTSNNIWYLSNKDGASVNKATQITSQEAINVLQRFERVVSYPEDLFVKKQIRCVVENSGIGRKILGNVGLKFKTGC